MTDSDNRTRQDLQAVFARASARRAERRVFVETLQRICARREALASMTPLLIIKTDRRRTPR